MWDWIKFGALIIVTIWLTVHELQENAHGWFVLFAICGPLCVTLCGGLAATELWRRKTTIFNGILLGLAAGVMLTTMSYFILSMAGSGPHYHPPEPEEPPSLAPE
jgi:MFS family permease